MLLENVPGLLSHDKGRTFATILSKLDELGYDVAWQMLNSKDSIDFNKLIPMPPELEIEEGSQTKRGLKAYKDFIEVYTFNGKKENFDLSNILEKAEQAFLRVRPDIDPAAWELGKKAFQNQRRWGFTTWCGFCTNRWGIKWNAYGYENGVQFDGHSLRFLSAWSPPQPVIAKLSEMYPDLDFTHQFASEDISVNCGEDEYHNGSLCAEYRRLVGL